METGLVRGGRMNFMNGNRRYRAPSLLFLALLIKQAAEMGGCFKGRRIRE